MKNVVYFLVCMCFTNCALGENVELNIDELLTSSKISIGCVNGIRDYVNAFVTSVRWGLEMFDSTSKLPDGLLYGNINQLGNFDECLAIEIPSPYTYTAKFCRSNLNLYLNGNKKLHPFIKRIIDLQANYTSDSKQALIPYIPYVKWSFCLPSECNSTDFEQAIETFVPPLLLLYFGIDISINATVDENECFLPDKSQYPPEFWTFIGCEFALVFTVIVCTLCDIWLLDNESENRFKARWLVQAFSLRKNFKQLFSLKREPGTMDCLHGIRVVSMFFILLAHRYYEETAGAVSNLVEIPEYTVHPLNQIVLNAMVDVDTFFVLSGFLGCYILLKEVKRRGHFSPLAYYVYRYARLTAPLAVVLAYYLAIFAHMGRGPLWQETVVSMVENCQKNWWTVLLYVQNYVGVPDLCISQSWYLAVDMQLAWVLPLLLLPMMKWPKQTMYLTLILLLASCFAPFAVTYANNFPWSQTIDIYEDVDVMVSFFESIFWPTHMRMTPYLVGVLLGYYMYNTKDQKIQLSKIFVAVGWFLSTAIGLTVMLTLSIPYQDDYEYSPVDAAFYAGFHRLGWSLFVAWVIFACVKGYGGIVNSFFSWKLFLPLSRLCYGVYLVQFVIILYDVGMGRAANFFSHFNSIHTFLGDQPMIFGLAFLLYLFVEAPVLNILRHFFRAHPSKEVDDNKSLDSVIHSNGYKKEHSDHNGK